MNGGLMPYEVEQLVIIWWVFIGSWYRASPG
jgi:hypothetical protein